ncbi:MAG: 4-hydroxy-3-methylbut-2-enyl diphosphate reductase, partial [Bacillota bacterium]
MRVLLARHFGFCFGVERAVHMAREAAGKGPLATLGPLIHNRRVVAELEAAGVRCVSSLDDALETVIFRTHGAGPSAYEEAQCRGLRVLDATCPFVRRAREEAQRLADQGYQVVVVGDPSHPEIRALVEWLGGQARVVRDLEEVDHLSPAGRVGVVAQTTLPREMLEQVAAALGERCDELRVADTICTATTQRQQATREVAREADLVLVVGDCNSANTRRLLEIARAEGCPARLVEGAEDLQPRWLEGVGTVGIVAGASTPEWVIKEVVAKVQELGGEDRSELEGRRDLEEASEEAAALDAVVTEAVVAPQVAPPEEETRAAEAEALPGEDQALPVEECAVPAADEAPVGEESAVPAADEAPVGEESAVPAADEAPVVEESAVPAADEAPVVEESAVPAADEAPV